MLDEPAPVVGLGGMRTEQEEFVITGTGDRELAEDSALWVEHRRQHDSTDRRHPIREQAREPGGGAGSGHVILSEVRRLDEPDTIADGGAFRGNLVPGVGTAERDVLDRFLSCCLKPQRVLEAVGGAPHRVRGS